MWLCMLACEETLLTPAGDEGWRKDGEGKDGKGGREGGKGWREGGKGGGKKSCNS